MLRNFLNADVRRLPDCRQAGMRMHADLFAIIYVKMT